MYQEDLLQTLGHGLHPFHQLPLIGVTAEFIELGDLGPQPHRLSEDGHFGQLVQDLAAQSVLRHESGDQHGIPRVFDVVLEVVQDASRLAHSRRGNDDEGTAQVVQRLGFAHVLHVAQVLEGEGVCAL